MVSDIVAPLDNDLLFSSPTTGAATAGKGGGLIARDDITNSAIYGFLQVRYTSVRKYKKHKKQWCRRCDSERYFVHAVVPNLLIVFADFQDALKGLPGSAESASRTL